VERQPPEGLASTPISRRRALQLGAGFAGAATFGLTGCTRATPTSPQPPEQGDGRGLVFLSTQLRPVEEAEKMRERILAGYDGVVTFIGSDSSPFIERVRAEAAAGKGTVALVGAQHGDLASLASEGLLLDLDDLAHDLADRNFNPDFLELARLGDGRVSYIPWAQSTYLMAARKEAVDMLQDGVDIGALSYDELLSWAARVNREQGGRKLGFPAAQDGLLRRFLQGYAYPSFTGRLHARFKSADAVTMWSWMRRAWAESNPRSPTYAFMHKPLQSGEVWIAWDHVARLVEALKAGPAQFIAFPAPTGPRGLGYVIVPSGLAIPRSSPDPDAAKQLIRYLTEPSTADVTLREVGFFPPTTDFNAPASLGAGIRMEAIAVQQQAANPRALASLLPVGLQNRGRDYDDVFYSTLNDVVAERQPIPAVLEARGRQLQAILDSVGARCWRPDPPSRGTCRVGG
jgi:multiple sugar transport system substrate-binding protein